MNKFDFCKAVFARFNKKWPYTGALADTMQHAKDNKTVDEAVKLIEQKAAKKYRVTSKNEWDGMR